MLFFSDFLQWRFLQDWEAITTIPGLLNTFLLPKLRRVETPDISVSYAEGNCLMITPLKSWETRGKMAALCLCWSPESF